jgi:glycine dehydrogenase
MGYEQPESDAVHAFARRHIGPSSDEVAEMLKSLDCETVEELISATVPRSIRIDHPPKLPEPLSESAALAKLRGIMSRNQVFRSFLGYGYANTITPPVIRRNVLENPGWYTAYTPYQAEISQGRLELLYHYQTLVVELTGLEVANSSLLDEATAAAEAMALCAGSSKNRKGKVFLVDEHVHPQTLAVLNTRAEPLGIDVRVGPRDEFEFSQDVFGMLVQYPSTEGEVYDPQALVEKAHEAGALAVMACDLLSLCLLRGPGSFGADVAVGSAQRLGIPLGYGGPHAAFMAATHKLQRKLPGRIVGLSHDNQGRPAFRLALQTREQHIRREKATSNICTAQVLLAVMSALYAIYHGPAGLKKIANMAHDAAAKFAAAVKSQGHTLVHDNFFDTVVVELGNGITADEVLENARAAGVNMRKFSETRVGASLDETVSEAEAIALAVHFASGSGGESTASTEEFSLPEALQREGDFLKQPVFSAYRTETQMMRYLKQLENKDLSLVHSMIPLGSCTMKLNAAAEMEPLSWPEVSNMHPFAPLDQARGYQELCENLDAWLSQITGFARTSLQPNAGSQGEYAGLLVIRAYHEGRGEGHRDICLIPTSAHGTNPASAVMAGYRVVAVKCDDEGNIDPADLREKVEKHSADLAACMITYPSTHGVFEEAIQQHCALIHEHGGQVYMDGANLNAQIGLTSPAELGADVCHLNLHKTFCIPHGGGGPGMGPIGVREHLAPYLPGHPVIPTGGEQASGAISAAPFGSTSILTISWMYIAMMGSEGLKKASEMAILNANYIARRVSGAFKVLYKGRNGYVAHECIVDLRHLKNELEITVEDVAKRLIDYGFHAPTMSWPVINTLMIEPTESESKEELDRFCDAMLGIAEEIREIADGKLAIEDSPLRNSPHPAVDLIRESWDREYSRQTAAYPREWLKENKYWTSVSRIDNAWGDRNLICACTTVDEAASAWDDDAA